MNVLNRLLMTGVIVCVALGMATAAQAEVVAFTDSSQLILAGRDVLAAVNFYAPTDRGANGTPGHVPVGSIQGVAFTNFDENDWTSILPTPYSLPVTQGTLTMSGNSKGGRENTGGQNGYVAITGPDATEANKFAGAGWFSGSPGQDNDMTFAFGEGYANTEVSVQLIGGGTSANSWGPIWDVFVNADTGNEFKGRLTSGIDNLHVTSGNPYLMTFNTTLDGSGGLVIDVNIGTETGTYRDIHLRGVTVAAVPEPASMSLLAIGGLGLLMVRRRRR